LALKNLIADLKLSGYLAVGVISSKIDIITIKGNLLRYRRKYILPLVGF
jgi:hypothetical protein